MVKFKNFTRGDVHHAVMDHCRCDFCGALLDVGFDTEVRERPDEGKLTKSPYYVVRFDSNPDVKANDDYIAPKYVSIYHCCGKHLMDVMSSYQKHATDDDAYGAKMLVTKYFGTIPRFKLTDIPNLELNPDMKLQDIYRPLWLKEAAVHEG